MNRFVLLLMATLFFPVIPVASAPDSPVTNLEEQTIHTEEKMMYTLNESSETSLASTVSAAPSVVSEQETARPTSNKKRVDFIIGAWVIAFGIILTLLVIAIFYFNRRK